MTGTEALEWNGQAQSRVDFSDEQIIARIIAGDRDAFDLVCMRYKCNLHRAAYRILKNLHDAEDAVQEAFLKAYRNIGSFRGASSLSTWLMTILINCCLMELRRQKGRKGKALNEATQTRAALIESIPDDSIGVEAAIVQAESVHLMRERIACLNPKFRVLMESKLDNELTLAELASQHGLSVTAVKSRLLRARRVLRGSKGCASWGRRSIT